MNSHDFKTIHVKDIRPGNFFISVERDHFQYQMVCNIAEPDKKFISAADCLIFKTLTLNGKLDYLIYQKNQKFQIFSKEKMNYYLENWESYCYTSDYLVISGGHP